MLVINAASLGAGAKTDQGVYDEPHNSLSYLLRAMLICIFGQHARSPSATRIAHAMACSFDLHRIGEFKVPIGQQCPETNWGMCSGW